ncbi:hypothetical protein [Pontixanthobacter aquaemixtae]|uniref:Uncharacterized protein n=1 Tax=Pontixanthobacter aquaemixtae TaxID=1958940 RepID=A0A844ZQL8_9SPHN|nr:hypothetical protein [Pontixanthobacter aquaemixtae]MXO90093.1 hypothetical protein [Pontixanthobacter aquaemixtae]
MKVKQLTRGLGLAICAVSIAAQAQERPQLSQAMFVENVSNDGATRAVKRADQLRKGDRVILLVKWNSNSANTGFTVSSAVPRELAFERSSVLSQAVSIDGGRNWGVLGQLVIRDKHGERIAAVEDVTHLRWKIPASRAAQGSGTITYSAIVR